mmetsp:Transcript_25161/g.84322  ORF Transcript_25161/g.84322 Transcript_25161/m.84322 type:complete len:245 (-) Transcript_25161:56-790(-)
MHLVQERGRRVVVHPGAHARGAHPEGGLQAGHLRLREGRVREPEGLRPDPALVLGDERLRPPPGARHRGLQVCCQVTAHGPCAGARDQGRVIVHVVPFLLHKGGLLHVALGPSGPLVPHVAVHEGAQAHGLDARARCPVQAGAAPEVDLDFAVPVVVLEVGRGPQGQRWPAVHGVGDDHRPVRVVRGERTVKGPVRDGLARDRAPGRIRDRRVVPVNGIAPGGGEDGDLVRAHEQGHQGREPTT